MNTIYETHLLMSRNNWNSDISSGDFVNRSYFRRFLALDCLFLQRLMTLKLPNPPFQGSNSSISPLHSPEKTTASHDVAPEVTFVGQPEKNSYIGIPEE